MDILTFQQRVVEAYTEIFEQLDPATCGHPVRFWAFVPGIHEPLGAGLDRYMAFNAGRYGAFAARFGRAPSFTRSIPTGSAVGVEDDRLLLHCVAADEPGVPVENPRQISAYHYSRRFGPMPPCFARATLLPGHSNQPVLIVGGTASITGEESRHIGDLDGTGRARRSTIWRAWLPPPLAHPRSEDMASSEVASLLASFREMRVYYTNPADQHTLAGMVRGDRSPSLPRRMAARIVVPPRVAGRNRRTRVSDRPAARRCAAPMSNSPTPLAPHPKLGRYYKTDGDRSDFVSDLFDEGAASYEWVCRVMSLGTGGQYRKNALRAAGLEPGMRVLDVATGTGLVLRPASELSGGTSLAIGLDPSDGMLRECRKRSAALLVQGRGEALPFRDGHFDMVSMGYGLRHVADLHALFREYRRVLRPGWPRAGARDHTAGHDSGPHPEPRISWDVGPRHCAAVEGRCGRADDGLLLGNGRELRPARGDLVGASERRVSPAPHGQ